MNETAAAAWHRFLADTGRAADTPCFECFHFCNTESAANELLALVLCGKKRATASLKACYDAEDGPFPAAGDLSLVTDFAGTPACVIETVAVTVLPFCEMTYEICSREGEDDVLETWRQNHRHYFSQECAELGLSFSEQMDVVFEDFEIVYRF